MNMQPTEAVPHIPEADTFDLRKSWDFLKQSIFGHKLLIGLTSLIAVIVMLLYIIIWPPVFMAEVIVLAEAPDDRQRESFYSHWNVFRSTHLPDEIELIGSRSVLMKTADSLNLTYDDVYHPFMSYAAYLWGDSLVGKTYRKLKYWIFPRACEPACPTEEERAYAWMLLDLAEGVALIPSPDSFVARVVVRGPSPRVAKIANTLIDVYLEERKLRAIAEARESYDSLKVEVDKAKAALLENEQLKEEYYTEQNLLMEFEKDKVEVTKWLELRAGILESESALATAEESLAEVERQLEGERQQVVSGRMYTQNTSKIALRSQLVELKMMLDQTRIRFRPDSPEVTDIEKQIASIELLIGDEDEMEESRVSEVLSSTYESLRQKKGNLQSGIAGLKAGLAIKKAAESELGEQVADIPAKLNVTHEMARLHNILEQRFLGLQGKLSLAEISMVTVATAPATLKIVDRALPPAKANWPKTRLFLLVALAMGAFGGAVLGLLLDLIYMRVNRYYLARERIGNGPFAILRKEPEYLSRVFLLAPPPKPRLLEKLSR